MKRRLCVCGHEYALHIRNCLMAHCHCTGFVPLGVRVYKYSCSKHCARDHEHWDTRLFPLGMIHGYRTDQYDNMIFCGGDDE